MACEWGCEQSAGSEWWTDRSACRVSAVGHAVAVKTGSSYGGPYTLHYVIFNLVDRAVRLQLFWHRSDRIRISLLFSRSVVSDSL